MRKRLFALAAVVAAFAASAALASIPDSSGVIHGCYKNSTGMVKIIDDSSQSCASSETALNWNQTGPQGSAGPTGPQGATGAQGAAGAEGSSSYTFSDQFSSGNGNSLENSTCSNGGAGIYAWNGLHRLGDFQSSVGVPNGTVEGADHEMVVYEYDSSGAFTGWHHQTADYRTFICSP
jgi:hypothetical protein